MKSGFEPISAYGMRHIGRYFVHFELEIIVIFQQDLEAKEKEIQLFKSEIKSLQDIVDRQKNTETKKVTEVSSKITDYQARDPRTSKSGDRPIRIGPIFTNFSGPGPVLDFYFFWIALDQDRTARDQSILVRGSPIKRNLQKLKQK